METDYQGECRSIFAEILVLCLLSQSAPTLECRRGCRRDRISNLAARLDRA